MNRTLRTALIAGVLIAAAGIGFLLQRKADPAMPEVARPQLPPSAIGKLMGLTLTDSAGKAQPLQQWQGKVLVVNFWATWCPPCREEMPAFSRLQGKLGAQGVQFLGIGIDSPSAIKEYAYQTPMAYPLLIGGTEGMELMRELGNTSGALPYTLVIARDGRPSFSRLGMVSESQLESLLVPLARP